MKKKLSYVIGIVFAVFMFLNFINGNKSEASTPVNPPIYMGVQEYRTDTDPVNMAYGIGNPDRNGSDDSSMVGKKIWDLVEYASAGSPTFDNSKNYYCVKADVGFRNINDRATYNLSYDLVYEKSEIQSSSNTYIKDMVNDDDIYYGLLALVDMLYLPGVSETSEKTELINAALTAAGIPTDRYTVEITDTDIEAIQQAAVWYFTEQNDELFATIYNQLGYQNTSWFTYKLQSMSEYKSFSDYNLTESTRDGEQRQLQAVYIYNYLINTAKTNATEYKNGTMKPKSKITLYINSGDMEQQPVIIIDRIPEEFDLSLRKYITKVDGQEVANTRVPNIDTTPLVNETDTTATYNHRKDPVVVKTGSIVTYNITVYNEGEIDGYVNEIKDQLPEGLRYVSMTPDANYTASYDETQNVVTIRRNDSILASTEDGLLSAYDGGDTLDSITFEIQCEVTSITNNDILTNVAYITEEQTADGTIIERGIEDRDSEPSVTPEVNQTNMDNYTGNTQNKPELGDPNYFYKGEQDDDDFEKLIVELEGSYQVQIEKVDKDNTDTKLAGAEFEVTLPGQSARPVSTGSNGIVDLGTVQITNVGTTDTITVKETKAPEGYNAVLEEMTIQVEKELSNGSYVAKSAEIISGGVEGTSVSLEGNTIKIIVADEKQEGNYQVQLEKVDKDNPDTKLAGAEFEVTLPGQSAKPVTTGSNGIVDLGTVQITNVGTTDTITVKETKAPEGYNAVLEEMTIQVEKELSNGSYVAKSAEIISGGVEGTTVRLENGIVKIQVANTKKGFDLSLRKYISKVNDTIQNRVPVPALTGLQSGTSTTAEYNHSKKPLSVKVNDKITYTIRVYNEGELDGYASEITDYLPAELEFIQDDPINIQYEWVLGEDGRTVTTDYLSKEKETADRVNLLKAFNGTTLDYKEVQIVCKINDDVNTNIKLTNIAEITKEVDENGNPVEDIDSDEDNVNIPSDEDLPGYKDDEIDKEYVPGQEDDDDFEKISVEISGSYQMQLQKVDKADTDVKLSGAEFEVTLPGQSAKPVTTGSNGIVDLGTIQITNVETIDTITVKETKPPEGYNAILDEMTIQVEKDISAEGNYVAKNPTITSGEVEGTSVSLEGNTVKIIVADEKQEGSYQLQLEKVDKDNPSTKLSGAEFEVTLPGQSAKTVTTGSNGIIDLGVIDILDVNTVDTIVIKETKAPEGYNAILDEMTIQVEKELSNGRFVAKSATITSGAVEGTTVRVDNGVVKVQVSNEKKEFDLSLRKFISKINDNVQDREPVPDVSGLVSGESTTAIYNHSKEPLSVKTSDKITYTIRIYNEGELNGYANEITDYLPAGLEFVEDDPINIQYEWVLGEDGRTVTTDYLSKEKETAERVNLIKAFDGTTLDYKDVQIVCKIKEGTITNIELTNIAEITEEVEENGNPAEDIDSDEDNVNIPSDEDLPGYKDDELDKEYVPGQEDDDDFEKIIVKEFDLALRKFITGVNEEEVTSRIPEVNYDAESDQITYEHDKTPVEVTTNDIVTYTIRIFNEGDLSGYAEEVADDIPEGLEFLPENEINQEYRWIMYDAEGNVTEDVSQAEKVVTDYLSMANGESMMEADETLTENPNLLQPFDKTAEISETNPDYKDVQIAFRVIEPATSDRILTNSAQIEEDADENGEPVEDIDSTPGEWNEGEDDQDQEHLELTYFDLSLRKWVTQAIVIENGKETVTQTGHTAEMDPEPVVKVELNRHNLDNIEVKFRYSIRITNEGEIAGYAKEITDYVPEGLMFVAEDNPGWTDEGNNVISTRLLENTLLQPGESAEVEVLLTWIKGEDNLGLKTNVAEISEDDNDKGYDDIDSTPDNREEGEDDIDDAEVLLSISTGQARIYIGLGLTVLITLGGGVILIKKFVL